MEVLTFILTDKQESSIDGGPGCQRLFRDTTVVKKIREKEGLNLRC
jgi:hypothetical protein